MIGFVEADESKKPSSHITVSQAVQLLRDKIRDQQEMLKTTAEFSSFPLTHNEYQEVTSFRYSYRSKHIRDEDNLEISIHHLLLDYNDILK